MSGHRRKRQKKAGLIPKTWYKRMLRAYFPLVFMSISAVIFVSFIIVTEMMTKEAEKANAVTASHMMDSIESRLTEIEGAVLREMASNRSFQRFISSQTDDNVRLTQYELSNELNNLIKDYPLIDSIYIYRASDRIVLTQRLISPLGQFPDESFIQEHLRGTRTLKWQPIRMYTDIDPSEAVQVISLVHKAPLPLGNQGLVVVNVRVRELLHLAERMINPELTLLEIRDHSGQLIYPESAQDLQHHAEYTFRQQLAGVGWEFRSGVKIGPLFEWVSVISYIWIAIGVLIVIGSVCAAIYIFKRNYRPIELVLQKVQQAPLRNLPKGKALDEFTYIERALENLVEQTKQYEKQHQDDLTLGKRQLLRDLLEGEAQLSLEEWDQQAKRFFLPAPVSRCTVAIVELKRYDDLEQGSEERDRSFLKFSLANAVIEHLRTDERFVETEWLSGERLAVLMMAAEETALEEKQLAGRFEHISRWIWNNLNISVRISIGMQAIGMHEIAKSCRTAETALSYQLVTHHKQPILYSAVPQRTSGHPFSYYQSFTRCIRELHQLSDQWSEHLDPIFEQMNRECLPDEEIRNILQFAVMMYLEEAGAVTDIEVRTKLLQWTSQLRDQIDRAEQLSNIYTAFSDHAEYFYKKYAAYKRSNKYLETINQVRKYVEEHYTDPDLSLTQIGDKFGLKPKYASQLFKEEFHMKFVDYLVQLRMEEAKKWLRDTEEPVHEIAAKVGYASSISFGRMFKKLEGITPGDYRKLMHKRGDETNRERLVE